MVVDRRRTGPCEFLCRDRSCLPCWSPPPCDGRPDCDQSDEFSRPTGTPALHASGQRLDMSGVQICVVAVAVVLTLGLITCVINHYHKMGARSWSERRRHPPPSPALHLPSPNPCPNIASALYSPTVAQERARHEMAAFQERQLRMISVQRDIALDLPATIHLPDEEEYSMQVFHLRTPTARTAATPDSEVHRAYIRPPPNRTVSSRSHSRDRLPPHKAPYTQTVKAPLVIRQPSASTSGGGPEGWLPPSMLTAPHIPATEGAYCVTTPGELTTMGGLYDPPPKYEDIIRTGGGV